ncbi:hypothetical protein KIN20_006975 [Parelaphostrongylus tenuis]|uniref:Uncharacterized protein n=1 Tax=Parelaphostrongylus tenuis TaxID=148309 RepID=A0AAD5M5R8_PARTN|nr:hypothetical protein KIN20_006975 [Parelaphostrongylus tenuis]
MELTCEQIRLMMDDWSLGPTATVARRDDVGQKDDVRYHRSGRCKKIQPIEIVYDFRILLLGIVSNEDFTVLAVSSTERF